MAGSVELRMARWKRVVDALWMALADALRLDGDLDNLTPLVPLSFRRRGGGKKRGAPPLRAPARKLRSLDSRGGGGRRGQLFSRGAYLTCQQPEADLGGRRVSWRGSAELRMARWKRVVDALWMALADALRLDGDLDNLTPLVPLSFSKERGKKEERGFAPLNSPGQSG